MSTTTAKLDQPVATLVANTHTPRSSSLARGSGILRSEWVKFRSLSSNAGIVLGAAAVMIITGVIFSGFVGGVFNNPGEASEFANNPVGATLRGTLLAPLIIGVLGIMAITSEYATGTIRTSLTVVPKRLPVLWAKGTVVASVAFSAMLTSTLIAFFAGQAIIASGDVATASLGDPGVLRALLGTAGYLTGIAIIGLGVGTLLRSSAAAISTLVATIFILPGLAGLLLPATSWRDTVLQYLPSNAGEAFMQVDPGPEFLTPTAGILVFAGWVAVTLAAAAVTLKQRPA
jgi:ABC-2 type transport system permease protein